MISYVKNSLHWTNTRISMFQHRVITLAIKCNYMTTAITTDLFVYYNGSLKVSCVV